MASLYICTNIFFNIVVIKINILRKGNKTLADEKIAGKVFSFLLTRVFEFGYSYQMIDIKKKKDAIDIITIQKLGTNWDEEPLKAELKAFLQSLGLNFKLN